MDINKLVTDGNYIVWPDCSYFSGPYKTSAAAKSELTKLKRKR